MLRNALILTSVLASPLALANGFYVGAGAGPAAANFNQNAHVVVNPPGGITANVYDSNQHSATGAVGTLFAGYQWRRNQYGLAGEVNASVTSMQYYMSNLETISGTSSSTTERIKNMFGVSVLPGYFYRDTTLFYARLGYVSGNFSVSTTDSSLQSISRYLNGFRYGIGVSEVFTPHISGRMEYSHTGFANTTFVAHPGVTTKSTTISPSVGEVEFSMVYNIA